MFISTQKRKSFGRCLIKKNKRQRGTILRIKKTLEFSNRLGMRGERESGRVYRGSHLHRGQPRRFSLSPDVRYYGRERGPSREPLYGGIRENGLL